MKSKTKFDQDKVLPIRLSSATYDLLKKNAEEIGVKPSIYIKSLIINNIRLRRDYCGLNDFRKSLDGNLKETDEEIMKFINNEIESYRSNK